VVDAMNRAADRTIDIHWHEREKVFASIGETLF
jgi:hypothetical protein